MKTPSTQVEVRKRSEKTLSQRDVLHNFRLFFLPVPGIFFRLDLAQGRPHLRDVHDQPFGEGYSSDLLQFPDLFFKLMDPSVSSFTKYSLLEHDISVKQITQHQLRHLLGLLAPHFQGRDLRGASNGLKLEKETTHFHHSWRRRASMA